MNKIKNLLCVIAISVTSVFALAEPATEMEVQDVSGLTVKVYKRPPVKRSVPAPAKPPKNIPAKPMKPQPPRKPGPSFPEDLTIEDGANSRYGKWFPWAPTGANKFPADSHCSQDALRYLLWQNRTVAAQGAAVNSWIDQCNDQISTPISRHSFLPLARYATVSYNFIENPNIRAVRATLPDGRLLKGFIALKPDHTPRPFIIAKCGMFCNAEQSTTHRAMMMHFFDESPFNVLTLENNTGDDFQMDNKALSLGGFDEGRQLYHIAQLLRSPKSPIADRISSVHVIGVSLGGSAALYSGLYASVNDLPGRENIQSVTAICPVVVLGTSAKRLFSTRPISTVASFQTLRQLKDIFGLIPVLNKILSPNWRKLHNEKLYAEIEKAIFAYYSEWTHNIPWDLKPFQGVQIHSLDQFWQLNDFRLYANQVHIPTITIAADNDDLVRVEANSKLLVEALKKKPNNQMQSVFFKQGNHCAFGVANGWGNYSMLLREYVLTHAPDVENHWRSHVVKLPPIQINLIKGEHIVETVWKAEVGNPNLQLQFKVYMPKMISDAIDCAAQPVYKADNRCYRVAKASVPIEALPLELNGAPLTEYEATSMTRFANTRFSVLDKNGELATKSNLAPKFVRVWEWH